MRFTCATLMCIWASQPSLMRGRSAPHNLERLLNEFVEQGPKQSEDFYWESDRSDQGDATDEALVEDPYEENYYDNDYGVLYDSRIEDNYTDTNVTGIEPEVPFESGGFNNMRVHLAAVGAMIAGLLFLVLNSLLRGGDVDQCTTLIIAGFQLMVCIAITLVATGRINSDDPNGILLALWTSTFILALWQVYNVFFCKNNNTELRRQQQKLGRTPFASTNLKYNFDKEYDTDEEERNLRHCAREVRRLNRKIAENRREAAKQRRRELLGLDGNISA
mmetsp:Transcript_14147/g.25287  ORF Transcript_14147/g.25287 Transcript_14147/m.25287 type:complete len:276 (-) Transcript_14147:151-978(-)|eukprot:CAMPEP_0184528406 /NCGR_PEP_ID=MMETSP0198_2-20121128/11773_1 /TAXON_ID=1112570 /ORGANISM="Thraustochytrium sp., Strain LLF1b" /LENGTH=275 /DNA_ID=CAMNT_0026920247 /DNA_START=932 /DNA_END=1759 /DNA_ORIENTATION=-